MRKLFISIAVACCALMAKADSTITVDHINYILNEEDQTAIVDGCESGISSLVIPSSLPYGGKIYRISEIMDYAFYGNQELRSVTLPDSVYVIGSSAFENCSNLYFVEMEADNLQFRDRVFYGCSSLKSFTIPNSIPFRVTDDSCFVGVDTSVVPVYVRPEYVSSYQGTYGWKDFAGIKAISPYGLYVEDNVVNESNYDDIFGDSTAYYNPMTQTLTLNGHTQLTNDNDNYLIATYRDLTIHTTEKKSTLYYSSPSRRHKGNALVANHADITMSGSGSISLWSDESAGVSIQGNLTIRKVNVVVNSFSNECGLEMNGELTVDSANVLLEHLTEGVKGCSKLTMINAHLVEGTWFNEQDHTFYKSDNVSKAEVVWFKASPDASDLEVIGGQTERLIGRKVLRNGQLLINRDGNLYNALGGRMK